MPPLSPIPVCNLLRAAWQAVAVSGVFRPAVSRAVHARKAVWTSDGQVWLS